MFKKIKNAGKKKEVTIEEKSNKSSLEPANEKDPRHATTKLEGSDHSSKKERKRSKERERGDKGESLYDSMTCVYIYCFVPMLEGHLFGYDCGCLNGGKMFANNNTITNHSTHPPPPTSSIFQTERKSTRKSVKYKLDEDGNKIPREKSEKDKLRKSSRRSSKSKSTDREKKIALHAKARREAERQRKKGE